MRSTYYPGVCTKPGTYQASPLYVIWLGIPEFQEILLQLCVYLDSSIAIVQCCAVVVVIAKFCRAMFVAGLKHYHQALSCRSRGVQKGLLPTPPPLLNLSILILCNIKTYCVNKLRKTHERLKY